MKRLFFLAIALLMLSTPQVHARGGRPTYRASNGNGPVSRLIEMERRKNAWLREKFLGR